MFMLKQNADFASVLYEGEQRMEIFNAYMDKALTKDRNTRDLKGVEMVSAVINYFILIK